MHSFWGILYLRKVSLLLWVDRYPSQNNDQFLYLYEDLINETTLWNPLFYLILGDFNVQSPTCWDDDKTSIEGIRLDALSSLYGLHQLIKEWTHLMESSASDLDLIFTNQSTKHWLYILEFIHHIIIIIEIES